MNESCSWLRRHKDTAQLISAILTSLAAIMLMSLILYLMVPGGIISRLESMQQELEDELVRNNVYERLTGLLGKTERVTSDIGKTLLLWNETIVEPQTLFLLENLTKAAMDGIVNPNLLGDLLNVTEHVDSTLMTADILLKKACDLGRIVGVRCE